MKRVDLAHVLRAASRIIDDDMLIIGSQAIHGGIAESDLPELTMLSREVDIAFFDDPDDSKADRLDGAIGEMSMFDQSFGTTRRESRFRPRSFPRAGMIASSPSPTKAPTAPVRGVSIRMTSCSRNWQLSVRRIGTSQQRSSQRSSSTRPHFSNDSIRCRFPGSPAASCVARSSLRATPERRVNARGV